MLRFFSAIVSHFVYSNIFIAACAMLMLWETSHLFAINIPITFYGFVFFGTLSSYSFHWGLTGASEPQSERSRWQQKYRFVHALIFPVGVAGVIYFLLQLREHFLPLAVAITITSLYSAPKIPFGLFKKLRNKAIAKTFILAFTWVYVCHLLPFILFKNQFNTDVVLFLLSKFLTIYAICMLFDIRDGENDTQAGIISIASLLNTRQVKITYYLALMLSSIGFALLLLHHYPFQNIAILIIPNVVLAMIYKFVIKNNTDKVFYFLLDGMMALSALILFVVNIINT